MDSITVAESLKKVRKEHNFKQREIAQAVGLDRSTYSFYETGKTSPSIETMCALAKIYNVSIGYLLGKENNNPELRAFNPAVSAGVDPIAYLSDEEKTLLMFFRVSDDETKKELLEKISSKNKNS